MLVGYMRVSTDGDRQVVDLQRDALLAAGVDERHLFEDHASGSRGDRTGLAKALAFLRPDDCLVVWKLDRLGCQSASNFDPPSAFKIDPPCLLCSLSRAGSPQVQRACRECPFRD